MKKLATLLLAAGMVVSASAPANAIDFNVDGFYKFSYHDGKYFLNHKEATKEEEGYTGDVICVDCQTNILPGKVVPATGRHNYGEWINNADGSQGRICPNCGNVETKAPQADPTQPTDGSDSKTNSTVIIIVIGSVVGAGAIAAAIVLILKKRKK